MTPDWSPQQQAALAAVSDWFQAGNEPIMRVFGYAGTGKTTLARHFASQISGRTEYAAFTGKAALVMRKSGCEEAGTIHSKIYKVKTDKVTGQAKFKLDNGGCFSDASLIVIDEVSMVDEDLGRDVMSFNRPVLVLGDPAQLPPVKGGGYFTDQEPDVMLTEVHRQAEDNPIIQLATAVREGKGIQHGEYGKSRVITPKEINSEIILAADQVLVGKNNTRHLYNGRIRELKGRKGWMPVKDDRLVCLRNNKKNGLFNGGLFTVQRANHEGNLIDLAVMSEDFESGVVATVVREEFFSGGHEQIKWQELRGTDQFNFGYALTVHKSQGSQWDNVVLFDESGSFREDADRWLYTGITRAAESVVIVRG
jgi:exodeoxyribonuclease-5